MPIKRTSAYRSESVHALAVKLSPPTVLSVPLLLQKKHLS